MDYDVLRTSIADAYKNFRKDDTLFRKNMETFYHAGKENPSVAKILMQNFVKGQQQLSLEMMTRIANMPTPHVYEAPMARDYVGNMYLMSLDKSIKSLEAANMYSKVKGAESGAANEFNNKWKELYPKTGVIRDRIIDAHRISVDKVNPKADWMSKIMYAFSIAELKKMYPKTLNIRYMLICDGRIAADKVTPKVKNWFKRLSYKIFI